MDGRILFINTGFANENGLKPQGAIISTCDELKGSAARQGL